MLKIAISGASGKMGQMITKVAKNNHKIEIGALIDQDDDLSKFIDKFDILIDFTRPQATLKYLVICKKYNKKAVIGTTGFDNKQLQQLDDFSKNIAIVFAPNMSIGVNLILKLLTMSAKIIGNDSDIEILETHHRYKVDAPSGTALKMGEIIANALGRNLKECAVYGRKGIEKQRDKKTIGFSTVRGGDIVGEHTAFFFMAGESIEITHKATSRMTFASGAMRASLWLENQNIGLYNMNDVLAL